MNQDMVVVGDENMSNMTCGGGASSERSASNSSGATASLLLYTSTAIQEPPPQPKRKRNLPGHPDPEAQVVALSPKTLMATNRFVCDICKKGFQRDQNLQLHRRGHNLPWKLKQRNKEEAARKKVYVCPESTCVHHHPSRALGDLTGIKKHFFRKHGEKKWKCDKCSKRYAVHSDWKAHFKICGTREYKCDCGTLFSRRDSFVAHRAFCEALAQESAKATTGLLSSSSHNNNIQLLHALSSAPPRVKKEFQQVNLMPEVIPSWFSHGRSLRVPGGNFTSPPPSNGNPNPTTMAPPPPISALQAMASQYSSSTHHHHHHMSATALLQKASQIGATMSMNRTNTPSLPHAGHVPRAPEISDTSSIPTAYNSNMQQQEQQQQQQHSREGHIGTTAEALFSSPHGHGLLASSNHDMMDGNNNNNDNVVSTFEEALRGFINNNNNNNDNNQNNNIPTESQKVQQVNDDEMTRDFLGINGVFPQKDLFSISGLHYHLDSSSYAKQNQNQPPWLG